MRKFNFRNLRAPSPDFPPAMRAIRLPGGFLRAFRALKRAAKFIPSLGDEEVAHFTRKFG
jgi:hypothetical protein